MCLKFISYNFCMCFDFLNGDLVFGPHHVMYHEGYEEFVRVMML